MNNQEFPNPRTEYGVIKRYLHVIALLQNDEDTRHWNARTLADMLSLDEEDGDLSDKNVRDYIQKHLEQQLEISVDREKGGRETRLAEDLKGDLLHNIALLYSSFVAVDSSREIILKNFLKKHPRDGLWMLATLYFATLNRTRVKLDYVTNSGYNITNASFHPYHMVFRNNNLYLLGRVTGKDSTWPLILNRVTNLRVTGETFDDAIPNVDDIMGGSLGAFIGEKYNVKLRFNKRVLFKLEQFLSILEPEFVEKDEHTCEVTFSASDDIYLCKQLFMYGKDVEIIQPIELREKMTQMLNSCMKVYEA
ncbi:MAG: WYL domain-containing protein [Spirochaetota bacterium]